MARIHPIKFLQHLPARIGVFFSTRKLERANKTAANEPKLEFDRSLKLAVLLLTWKRPELLDKALETLAIQTYGDFTLFISNANEEITEIVDNKVAKYQEKMENMQFTKEKVILAISKLKHVQEMIWFNKEEDFEKIKQIYLHDIYSFYNESSSELERQLKSD